MEQCRFVLFHPIVEASGFASGELSIPPKRQKGLEHKTRGLCCFLGPQFGPNWALGRACAHSVTQNKAAVLETI